MKAALKIMLVLAGIVALSLAEISLAYWSGGKDVRNFCREVKFGMPIARLTDLAKKYNVRYRLPGVREDSGTYRAFVNTPRSFGRHTCMVRHDNTAVIASQYGFAD